MIRRPIALAAVILIAAAALASCGKEGELERPAPLWGAKAKAQYEADQRAAAASKAQGNQDNQIEPLPDDNGANAAGP